MKRRTIFILGLVVAVVLLGAAGSVGANPSQDEPSGDGPGLAVVVSPLLQYQARLTDPSSGDPIADGDYAVTFRLYEVDSGGTALWSESKAVAVANGLLSTALGDPPAALDQNLFHGQGLWLEIEVEGEVLSPRQRIMPVAYAFSLVPGAVVAEDTSGPVLTASNTGSGEGLRGESAAGHGVYGLGGSGDADYGGYFEGWGGVVGWAGDGYGGYFRSDAIQGVYAVTYDATAGNAGVHGVAVTGVSGGPSQEVGVLGEAAGGYGVYGESTSYYGVYGKSVDSTGVYGQGGTGSSDYGGTFSGWGGAYADGDTYGVFARGGAVGVYGYADGTTGTNYGVYGRSDSADGYAGYFNGDVRVTGELSSGDYTNSAMPIAYGVVRNDGTLYSGTSNVSSTWNATYSRYEITISGYSYSLYSYATVVTPIIGCSAWPCGARTDSVSGRLLVYIYNRSGTVEDCTFQFVTFKP